jgi:hypothetical protein
MVFNLVLADQFFLKEFPQIKRQIIVFLHHTSYVFSVEMLIMVVKTGRTDLSLGSSSKRNFLSMVPEFLS